MVFQDVFYGGVTGSGYSPWVGDDIGYITINVEPNSVIRKALLLTSVYGSPTEENININGQLVSLNPLDQVGASFEMQFNGTLTSEIKTIVTDITSNITPATSLIEIIPVQNQPQNGDKIYTSYYVLVLYENYNLAKVSTSVFVNEQNTSGLLNYNLNGINTMDTLNNVGIALNSDHICINQNDGSFAFVEGDSIGLIYGKESNNFFPCSGVRGDFFYQNSTLTGLSGDVGGSFMNGTDGIANIESYLTSTNQINFQFEYESLANPTTIYTPLSNAYLQFFLTHTTPCDTFSVSVPSELTICRDDTATINVSGGTDYEWSPQVGLSCYNCPNPVITADSNMYYSLRVWNTDSCSKVLPIKINVLELPHISDVTVWDTPCSDSIGQVMVEDDAYPFSTYTLNDTLTQFSNHFYFLPPGTHQVVVSDTNNCKSDTLVTVNRTFDVVADFEANPEVGEIPFDVNFTNTSSGATEYTWYVQDDTLTSTDINQTFTEEGVFEVMLVATDQYPVCSDTTISVIIAETPFRIFAPTIVNKSDGNYKITVSGTSSVSYQLYDELGQLIFNKDYSNTSDGELSLWSMNKVSKGMYFYTLRATSEDGLEKVFSGKLMVM